ncbi:MAG TPA: 4'-phosphopantetheinyl transferase superfamily protein [Aggregatilineales bacterium]|nr:4'-phosphopantetheinyl transferase superfamily protein [Aggregatilineales bacterium]
MVDDQHDGWGGQMLIPLLFGESLLPLSPDSVHIWQLPLLELQPDFLSVDERVRAARFRFDQDRMRWRNARSMLRQCLAQYVKHTPESLRFGYTTHGKPFLADHPEITFNLSHAGDYGLLAVTCGRQVGVDIELVRPDFADPAVAWHFFSDAEQSQLAHLATEKYTIAFFTCWTRKEAYIKARGEGLSHPLKDFDVSIQSDSCNLLLSTRPNESEALNWHVQAVKVPDGYLGAVATSMRD